MSAHDLISRGSGWRLLHTLGRGVLAAAALCLFSAALPPVTFHARSQPQSRPTIKDFGSSLKRLKGDAEKKPSVPAAAADKGGVNDAGDEEVLLVETSLVVADVLVLDAKGFAVRGLKREDFVVTEEGRPQEIGTFALGDDAAVPRSIVLIIDYSGSMSPFIKNSIEAAKTLVDQLNPHDRMAIVTDDVDLLVGFTQDKAELKRTLEALGRRTISGGAYRERFGRSRQYSALMATLHELFGAEDTRPIIIFQTDGDEINALRDSTLPPLGPPPPPGMSAKERRTFHQSSPANFGEFSLAEVFKAAERSRVTIYSVIPGVRLIGLAPGEEQGRVKVLRAQLAKTYPPFRENHAYFEEVLNRLIAQTPRRQLALFGLAKLTGGWTDFLEDPSQAAGIYARIFSDINRRYVIGYYPANKERDGRRRSVKIKVRGHSEYTVWGRKSYYAPGPGQ